MNKKTETETETETRTNLFTEETDINTLPLFAKSTQRADVQSFAPKAQPKQMKMFAMEF